MDEFDANCALEYVDWQSTVENIEKALQIKTSESRIEGVAAQDLETAAQLVMYLSSCPKKSLLLFYMDLFQHQRPSQIILTLNRIINGRSENELKTTAKKIFIRMTTSLSIDFNDFTTGD